MLILGIESSCDETAAAVVEDGRRVLSNVIASQVEEHKLYGGVVPEIASRRHCEAISGVVRRALKKRIRLFPHRRHRRDLCAGADWRFAGGRKLCQRPGAEQRQAAVPVHHLRSHMAANYLTHPDLKPPFLCLVVSAGTPI